MGSFSGSGRAWNAFLTSFLDSLGPNAYGGFFSRSKSAEYCAPRTTRTKRVAYFWQLAKFLARRQEKMTHFHLLSSTIIYDDRRYGAISSNRTICKRKDIETAKERKRERKKERRREREQDKANKEKENEKKS